MDRRRDRTLVHLRISKDAVQNDGVQRDVDVTKGPGEYDQTLPATRGEYGVSVGKAGRSAFHVSSVSVEQSTQGKCSQRWKSVNHADVAKHVRDIRWALHSETLPARQNPGKKKGMP